jgi:hypothetical protein
MWTVKAGWLSVGYHDMMNNGITWFSEVVNQDVC